MTYTEDSDTMQRLDEARLQQLVDKLQKKRARELLKQAHKQANSTDKAKSKGDAK